MSQCDLIPSRRLILARTRCKMVQHHVAPLLGAYHHRVIFLNCTDVRLVVARTGSFGSIFGQIRYLFRVANFEASVLLD